MASSSYKINLKKLCECMSLGYLISEPLPIEGGVLHKMFKIETTKGRYAVKALNPLMMQQNTALNNFIFSEKVAKIAFDNGINALPAIITEKNSMNDVDGQFYLVFPWFDGKTVETNSVDNNKCMIIGKLIAKIHNLDFSPISKDIENNLDLRLIDWSHYLKLAESQNVEWLSLFFKNISELARLEETANGSYQKLFRNSVISHRDLKQKNVLWNDADVPMIIDWEAAGYINPVTELLDVSLFWTGGIRKLPNEQAFKIFIESYYQNGGHIKENINDVLNSRFQGKLNWLEFCIKRSLRIECNDDSEQQLGTRHVFSTLNTIIEYKKSMPVLLEWLTNIKETFD